ncbi:MAG: NTP transferase domain-containing protein [Desulfuromonadaceae bacterium]|nr:NTP transferase domain-containing protein [Desulfuromonadaceae bacterium]
MSALKPTAPPREKAVAFIVARLSSSRLPAKQLRMVGDKPVVQWIIDNLRRCHELDEIVIATVAEDENLPLRDYAEHQGLPCFWYQGEIDHVTTRLRRAAEHYQADICLLISGDCPLVDAEAVDLLVSALRQAPEAEVLRIENPEETVCMLEGVHAVRRTAWQRADDLSVRPEQKEHQFPVIGQQSQLFSWLTVHLPKKFYAQKHRLSVDTLADLEFMNTLHDQLQAHNKPFSLENVLALLETRPQLRGINDHVYQRQLIETKTRLLFIVDAGGSYGLGHLTRSAELARQIVERKGWPVTFVIDDDVACHYLEQRGFRTHWGTLGRPTRSGTGQPTADFDTLFAEHSLLLIDIFDQRSLPENWRSQLPGGLPVVSVGNAQPWAEQTDLLIMPGVSRIPQPVRDLEHKQQLRVVDGLDALILRREFFVPRSSEKDLDLLVYLHHAEMRQQLAQWLEQEQISALVLNEFCPDMAERMARSRFYLGGFGTASYEALALNACPICWPHSAVNRCDALRFYTALSLPPLLAETPEQLIQLLRPLLSQPPLELPRVQDNSARLIKQMVELIIGGEN